jgi:tRNA 2-thiouridine synthesizing protein A
MTDQDYDADLTIDSRGATCPGPLMDLIGKVKETDPGIVIELLTSDSSSSHDVPEWVDETPHEYLGTVEDDDFWRIYVEVV